MWSECRLVGLENNQRPSTSKFHIVPIALLVGVQCFREKLYKAVEWPSIRRIVLSAITGLYFRRRMRLTIFELDEMK